MGTSEKLTVTIKVDSKFVGECFENPIMGMVIGRLLHQQEKVINAGKYKELVSLDNYSLIEWFEHMQSEMTDYLIYAEALKQKFIEQQKEISRLERLLNP